MRIGSRQAPQTVRQPSSLRATPADFGAGVADALNNLAGAASDYGLSRIQLEEAMKEREQRQRSARNDVAWLQWRGEERRRIFEETSNVEPGAEGITNRIHDSLSQSFEAFAQERGLDADERLEYEQQFERFRQDLTTQAFQFEFEAGNELLVNEIMELTDAMRQDLRNSPGDFWLSLGAINEAIDKADLPPMRAQALKDEVSKMLAGTVYEIEMERAALDMAPAGEADGRDVVAPGTSAFERVLLNTIAGTESPDYNTITGGAKFTGYRDHPRRRNAAGTSDAAGRYQFLSSTWDYVRRNMEAEGYDFGPEPFSPVNQDRAALWYANYRYEQYARRNGFRPEAQTIQGALQFGEAGLALIRQALAGEGNNTAWKGLQTLSDDQFIAAFTGEGGMERGPIGSSQNPDIWNDLRFNSLDFDERAALEASASQGANALRSAAAQRRREQEQALFDSLRNMFNDGDENAARMIQDAINSYAVSDPAKREQLRGMIAEMQLDQQALAQVQRDARPGGRTYFGEEDQDTINRSSRQMGITRGIAERDQTAAQNLHTMFGTFGMLPDDAVELLTRQINSGDIDTQLFASMLLADLYDSNPHQFMSSAGTEAAERGAWFSSARRYAASPRELLERFNELRTPQGATIRAQLESEAREKVADFRDRDTFRNVASWWERNMPEMLTGIPRARLPEQAAANRVFQEDYRRLFEEHYVLVNGDESLAHELTGALMGYSWHVDPLSGSLMKYSPLSPSAGTPMIGGNYDWIREVVDEQIADFAHDPDRMVLIATPTTEEAILSGQPPSYQVFTERQLFDTGVMTMDFVRDDQGEPIYVTITPSERVTRRADTQAELTNAEERLRRMNAEVQREWGGMTDEQRSAHRERTQDTVAQIERLRAELQETTVREFRETVPYDEAEAARLEQIIEEQQRILDDAPHPQVRIGAQARIDRAQQALDRMRREND